MPQSEDRGTHKSVGDVALIVGGGPGISDESVEAVIGEVVRRTGRIDVLVNNAGFSVAPADAANIQPAGSQSWP